MEQERQGRETAMGREWVELAGANGDAPPKRANATKGTTKYPFEALDLGHIMYVSRSIGAVRDAVKRYVSRNKGLRFSTWTAVDGRVAVKRTK